MLFVQRPPVATLLGLSALGAFLFHYQYAGRSEIDFRIWRLLRSVAIVCLLFSCWSITVWQLPLVSTLHTLGTCLLSFSITLLSSILIYRGYFHRLGKFPGPYPARFSSLWVVKKSSGDFTFHQVLTNLHCQYGDFVRIDALSQLMALNKGVFWSHTGDDHTKLSFSLSRVPEDHKQRRRPWEQAFSTQSLDKFNDDIQDVIGVFLQQAKEQGTLDVPAAMGRVSFDIMGLVGFGREFQSTLEGVAHPALVAMRKAHFTLGALRWMPWLMHMLSSLPGGGSAFAPFLALCATVVRERQMQNRSGKTLDNAAPGDRRDVMSYLLEAMDEGGPAAPPNQEAMDAESRVMIAAGADTTQSALANALWFLASAPAALGKLQTLLDGVFPYGPDTFDYAKLIGDSQALEWVDAIIQETLRLRPAGVCGNPRDSGPEGLIIPASEFGPETWIPENIEVLVPTWVIQRDERWFAKPHEFIPDRWVSGSGVFCDKSAYFPFNIGKHACVGKPLAMQELRSVIARTALTFDLQFPYNEDWQSYEERIMDTFTMTLPPFRLVFKTRTPT